MEFLFETTATMKEYNRKKWWIDHDIIPTIKINADSVKNALKEYQTRVSEKYGIDISNHAIKHAEPIYIGDETGDAIQTGYVITGKTLFDNGPRGWVENYIDLWVNISVTLNPFKTEAIR